ncbi:MAG TPA: DUF2946 domain-containing protein [Xanthobacteraceae bacterium]|nr:DUF2946 domain-containing protein [Xanthobacteraceae bacterium]
MRRRLGLLFPIVLIAMLVQILAPIGASWAFGAAASDPLHLAGICSSTADDGGNSSQSPAAINCCQLCYVAQSVTPTGDPQASVIKLRRDADTVVWFDVRPLRLSSAIPSQARARAPPVIS